MPRRRDGVIHESIETLQQLEAKYRGKPEAARIKVVRVLKEQPERQIEEVAALVGYAPVSVKRWLKIYREEGLEHLIQMGVGGKGDSQLDRGMNLLKKKLMKGELQGLREVRRWIETYQANERVDNGDRGTERHKGSAPGDPASGADDDRSREILDGLLAMMPALSATRTTNEWGVTLRKALMALFPDIDHITIAVNMQCPIDNPVNSNSTLIRFDQRTQSESISAGALEDKQPEDADSESERIGMKQYIQEVRRGKFSYDNYYPPICKVYYYAGVAYIGYFIFWRERSKPPISEETLTAIDRLREFFVYSFAEFIGRQYITKPMDYVFSKGMEQLTSSISLTSQEIRILYLQLVGQSYEEIARALNISVNTVRTHVKSIYTKTDTHSQAEFFGKYFTPYVHPSKENE